MKLEQILPPIQSYGLVTSKNATFGGTVAVTGALTGSSLSGTGTVTALSGTATTAGGATSAALSMGTAAIGVYFGSGAPTITAAKGSIYLRSDGSSTSTRLYVNTDGATTWTNVTTAA